MSEKETEFDLVVVGAGAAGLCLSEIASRSGKKTCLLESGSNIFPFASREHHGWFHMGSLYSIFWRSASAEALLKNIECLLLYYHSFENMNLKITDDQKLFTDIKNSKGWLTGNTINYLIACHNDTDFADEHGGIYSKIISLFKRFTWHMRVRKFVQRHSRFENYNWNYGNLGTAAREIARANFLRHSRQVINRINQPNLNLDENTHIALAGFDQSIRTPQIGVDLLNSFLQSGGNFKANTTALEIRKKDKTWVISTTNGNYSAKNVVMCTGKWNQHIRVQSQTIKSGINIISPLLIVHPKLCDENFVRMTPVVKKSINHLKHSVSGNEYSVVGGGYQLPEDASTKEREVVECSLKKHTEDVFNINLSDYEYWVCWGTKTENILDKSSRNYQFMFREVEDNLWSALPGKFSLGFSLAVKGYEEIFGCEPSKTIPAYQSSMSIIEPIMLHAELVKKFQEPKI
jgi:glycine/D-amino acid oxidase-like deaminating enzyme